MKRIDRSDILDLETYEARRTDIRRRVLEVKDARRVHMGDHLTFLFENTETLTYQVQEMLRIERLSDEKDVAHEITTYNDILPGEGGLACSLLIEIENEAERDQKLRQWLDLPEHIFLKLETGRHVPAKFDPRQIGDERLSSVQYLEFDCGGVLPVGLVCTRPGMELFANFDETQKKALAEDLGLEE